MSLKSKLLTAVFAICTIVATLLVGVFAIRQVDDFNVGGDIGFTATGINATISKATLEGITSTNSSAMQEVTINTGHSEQDVNTLFASWRNLNLKLAEGVTSGTISFSITLTKSLGWDDYVEIIPKVNVLQSDNIDIKVVCTEGNYVMLYKGDTPEFSIIFTVIDAEASGFLSDFQLSFDLKIKEAPVYGSSSFPEYLLFDENNPTEIVIDALNCDLGDVDIVIPSVIIADRWIETGDYSGTTSECFIISKISSKRPGGFIWSLKSITLPNTLNTIEEGTFYSCGLTSIEIPNSVTSIGDFSFEGCKNLRNVKLSANSKWLSDSVFCGCESLESIEIPYGVTSISDSAFSGCLNLTAVTIPSSVTGIYGEAFAYCEKLTSVTIPSSVTRKSIGKGCFRGCNLLEKITIPFVGETPSTNNFISWYFGGSSYSDNATVVPESLKTVTITNATTIPERAFHSCANIETIKLNEGVTSIGYASFYNCSKLANVYLPYGLLQIGPWAFEGATSLVSISMPDTLKTLDQGAFYNCTALISLVVPDSVTIMRRKLVDKCSSLKSLTIPFVGADPYNNVTTETRINHFSMLFESDGSVGSVAGIPSTLTTVIVTGGTSIAANAFKNCSYLQTISIPNTVTSIAQGAFAGCSALTKLSIPFVGGSTSSNTYLDYIFGGTSNTATTKQLPSTLTTVVITGGTSIPEKAFYYCTNITTVVIPDTVTSIGKDAFVYCSSLVNVNIPNSVTSLGNWSFTHCTSLKSFTIPSSVTSLPDYLLTYSTAIESLTIPFVGGALGATSGTHFSWIFGNSAGNVTLVPTTLTSVTVTGGTTIAADAFAGCTMIKTLTLGEGVQWVGGSNFTAMTSLTTLTCLSKTPPIIAGSLPSTLTSIKVPAESVNTYKATTYWTGASSKISAI